LPQRKDPLYQLFAQDADTFGGDAVQQNNSLANFIAPTYDIGKAPNEGIITEEPYNFAELFKSGAEPAPTVPDFNVRPPIVEPIVERDPFNPNSGIITDYFNKPTVPDFNVRPPIVEPIVERDPFNPNSGIATEEPFNFAELFKSGSEPAQPEKLVRDVTAPIVPKIDPRSPGNQFIEEASQQNQPATPAAAQQPKTNYIDALSKQILGQGYTDKWTGSGFGSAEANAKDMARILDSIGITDIKQFGLIDKPYDAQVNPDGRGGYVDMQGKPVDPKKVTAQDVSGESGTETVYTAPTTTKVYGNKVTGQEVPMTYSERQTGNAWGGTFQGAGNTGYRVKFGDDGTPYFYTTGASSDNMAQFAPLLAMASFIPGVAPFAQGLNALMAAKSGNVLGAIGGFAGLGGLSDVANAANFANAAQHKDILGMLGSGSGLAGVGDIGGVNIKDIIKGIGAAKALQSGDPLAILRAASGYMGGTGQGPDPKDFIEGYFQPGGEGYIDPNKEEQTVNQNPDASSELLRMLNPYLSEEQPGERRLPAEQPSSITEEEITPNALPFDTTNIMPTLPTLPTLPEEVPELVTTGGRDRDFDIEEINPNLPTEVPGFDETDIPELVMKDTRPSRDFDIEEINPNLPTEVPGFDEYNRDFDIEEIDPNLPTEVPGITTPTSPRVTTKTPTKVPTKPAAPATPAATSGMDLSSLLALLAASQQPQQQASMQDPYAHIKLMEDLFGSTIDVNSNR
jgi:hypothetical protein